MEDDKVLRYLIKSTVWDQSEFILFVLKHFHFWSWWVQKNREDFCPFSLPIGLFAHRCFGGWIHMEPVTNDKVLIAVFGGMAKGTGIGSIFEAEGLMIGLRWLPISLKRISLLCEAKITLFLKLLDLCLQQHFLWYETAMYSLLTYFTASKLTDYVVEGFEKNTRLLT